MYTVERRLSERLLSETPVIRKRIQPKLLNQFTLFTTSANLKQKKKNERLLYCQH